MNSSIVSREIKNFIWPKLRAEGFSTFTARTAWRHHDDGIDILNFQSFTRDIADSSGFTTFSFAVRLSWFPTYIPPTYPPPVKNGKLLPAEAGCNFRHSIRRTLAQPGNEHKDVWSLYEDGSNLAECIGNVEHLLPVAYDWFSQFRDRRQVLTILLGGSSDEDDGCTFNDPSPRRSYLTGYVAYRLGDMELARQKLKEAVDSKCYVHLFSSVEGAICRAI